MVTTKQQSQELIKQVDLVAKAGRQLLENITTLEKEVYKVIGGNQWVNCVIMISIL